MQTQQNNKGVMYKLDFPNGKSYIGVTKKDAKERFNQHVKMTRSNNAKAVHLAINKYGKDNVVLSTIAVGSMKYLYDLEIRAIRGFRTKYPDGYNLTVGGDGARGLDDETRAKMGAKNKGRIMSEHTKQKISSSRMLLPPPTLETRLKLSRAAKGRVLTQEHKNKIKKSNLNKVRTEEHCRKISLAKLGKKPSEANLIALKIANTGRVKTEEEILKISLANKGKKLSQCTIEKIRSSATGRTHSESAKMKVSEANKGKVLSQSTKDKISANKKQYWAERKLKESNYIEPGSQLLNDQTI